MTTPVELGQRTRSSAEPRARWLPVVATALLILFGGIILRRRAQDTPGLPADGTEPERARARRPGERPRSRPGQRGRLRRFATGALLVTLLLTLASFLKEIGAMLSRISGGGVAYGPSVFTGFKKPWDASDLEAAEALWRGSPSAGTLVRLHLFLDVPFSLALGTVLYLVLHRVSSPVAVPLDKLFPDPRERFRAWRDSLDHRGWILAGIALGYTAADLAENGATLVFFDCSLTRCAFADHHDTGPNLGAWIVHALTDVKWVLFAAALVLIVLLFVLSSVRGTISLSRSLTTRARRGAGSQTTGPAAPLSAPLGLYAIATIYVALVAVPIGGALDQTPDIVRGQFDDATGPQHRWGHVFASGTTSVLLLLVLVLLAAPRPGRAGRPGSVHTGKVLFWTGVLTAVLAGAHVLLQGVSETVIPTAAPLIVVGSLAFVAWLVRTVAPPTTEPRVRSEVTSPGDEAYDLETRAATLTGLIAGAVFLGTCLGVVRALTPVVLGGHDAFWDTGDRLLLVVAGLLAVVGTAATITGVRYLVGSKAWHSGAVRAGRAVLFAVIAVLAVSACLEMAHDPMVSDRYGALATLNLILILFAVGIAALGALTQRFVWSELASLRLGRRTPWVALLVATWVVASAIDTSTGYHDARTVATDTPVQRSLDEALEAWLAQWSTGAGVPTSCLTERGTLPLVLVAAPGGGAKAAYWTAYGMDRIFGADTSGASDQQGHHGVCPASLFAASGVSGGALGLTTRLAIEPADPMESLSAEKRYQSAPTVDLMTNERPLSAAVATMLLRDLPAQFVVANSSWRDRGAVLEDAWTRESGRVLLRDDKPLELSQVGEGWWATSANAQTPDVPVLLLNGSSVSEGCRAVVANVVGLAADPGACFGSPPASGLADATRSANPVAGPVSGSVDVLSGLLPATGYGGDAVGTKASKLCAQGWRPQSVRATTAALLAARFPYVTPSAALRHCPPSDSSSRSAKQRKPATTYVVDGGYLENTGLFTLLQVWDDIADDVIRCNEPSGRQSATLKCPQTAAGPVVVEPFLVVLDNHYRSEVTPPPASQPHELTVPLQTKGKKVSTLEFSPLEQEAAAVISRQYGSLGLACNRFIRLNPRSLPAVQAPLAWALAQSTRERLAGSFKTAFADAGGYRAFQSPPCS